MSIVSLARDLDLSISTVSRALNGYKDVSPETRERIRKRASEIGYRPNPGARRLKSGKTCAVGMILPAVSEGNHGVDSVYSGLMGGVATELEAADYHLIATVQTRTDPDRETALYENLVHASWVDALIIGRTRVNDPRVALARKARIPFVTYGRTNSSEPYAWVDTDNEQAFYLLTKRQIESG
ncbi:MAG TPA: LacI family DNA-binding transcriptional regulator, partial [Opitutaceae bacterium]|nr:LacI family DNA-binding transcriptional regulator [Opitutaceae bacterium]